MSIIKSYFESEGLSDMQSPDLTLAGSGPKPASVRQATLNREDLPAWSTSQKILFRIAFVFFVLMSLPFNAGWYHNLFTIDWLHLHYRDLYDIARFSPGLGFLRIPRNSWLSLLGYGNWVVLLVIAVLAGFVWSLADSRRRQYNLLYYWLRVIVRYRAGIGIIGFGFTKLFPVQMPYPSLGLLNTHFGDFTAQKIFWLSIGIVPWYQVFAGIIEVAAGTFLLFKRTTTLGAVMLLGALGDITYVNFAYDGGVHEYASYFVLLALFLLVKDAPYIYRLLIQKKVVRPFYIYPQLNGWQKATRYILKGISLFLFLGVLFYVQYINFRYDPYKQPAVKGVSELRGNYEVQVFRINGREIPYNPLDTQRWQDVSFENWSSLSFRVARPGLLDLSNGGGSPMQDVLRSFEITGTAGGRNAFHYFADTLHNVLYMENKNMAGARQGRFKKRSGKAVKDVNRTADRHAVAALWNADSIRELIMNEKYQINPLAYSTRRDREYVRPVLPKTGQMVLHYRALQGGDRVILDGLDINRDSLHIELTRTHHTYYLTPSTLNAGTY